MSEESELSEDKPVLQSVSLKDRQDFMKIKIAWYGEMIAQLKKLSAGIDVSTKNEKMLGLMEFINLEIAIDQGFIAGQLLDGAAGQYLKKLEIFKALLGDMSYRLKFYTDTKIRGIS